MNKLLRAVMTVILVLSALLPACAYAADEWREADYISEWYLARYDLSAPAYFSERHKDWRLYYQYAADPADSHAMLLNWKLVDAAGQTPQVDAYEFHIIYLPYPQGHDAAMGYDYVILPQNGGQAIEREVSDQAIAFRPAPGHAAGQYRISWSDAMNPRAAAWALVMSGMDWSGSSCSYTVGAGGKQVSVSRQGRSVTISGGEIKDVVRFANKSAFGDDYEAEQGWHTESGSYTFRDVTLLDDIYIWAHKGEDYTITLDESVKGGYGMLCELQQGANLNLINNDIICCDSDYSMIIQAETDCSMSVTGNGKILIGEGWDWSDENADSRDEVPIRIMLGARETTNEGAIRAIEAFEGNIVVSYDQVETEDGYPPIRSYCYYMPDENDPYLAFDVMDPETGRRYELDPSYIIKMLRPDGNVMTEPVLRDESGLGNAALYRPLLVAPSCEAGLYLRSEIIEETPGRSICYEIHLVDSDDRRTPLTGSGTLYIPYPEGMDMESAAGYEVTIRHDADDGEEIFSTADGTVLLTPYGFCVGVSSLSPFEVSWTRLQMDLPETGDRSGPALYAALLVLSLAAALCLTRRPERA